MSITSLTSATIAGAIAKRSALAKPAASGGGGGGASTAWTRPDDWLAMPTVATTEQKVVGLHAVWPSDGNFVAVTCAGNYQVDWGDGNTTTHSSGAAAYHEYDYSTISASTDSTRGYRQVLVTITPQAGANLTSVNFYVKHNQSGLVSGYSTGWLELLISLPQCSASGLTIGNSGTNVRQNLLERVAIIEQGALNTYANLFHSCYSLQDVQLDDSSAVTNMQSMFYNCYSIKNINVFDTSAVTTMNRSFQNCYCLQSVPAFNTSLVSNFAEIFSICRSLNGLGAWDVSGAISSSSYSSMFSGTNDVSWVLAVGFKYTFSVASCKLSASDLDTLYTNLASVVGQTITVSGNYGTAGDDPTIATNKGWTVTG